mmetsp:Transcript_12103/g.27944  ORF Transcript_12103/g.27944 Transcript_12103/m.27944 type:complete len:223 (-) Transcript_12103:1467-2135(-)
MRALPLPQREKTVLLKFGHVVECSVPHLQPLTDQCIRCPGGLTQTVSCSRVARISSSSLSSQLPSKSNGRHMMAWSSNQTGAASPILLSAVVRIASTRCGTVTGGQCSRANHLITVLLQWPGVGMGSCSLLASTRIFVYATRLGGHTQRTMLSPGPSWPLVGRPTEPSLPVLAAMEPLCSGKWLSGDASGIISKRRCMRVTKLPSLMCSTKPPRTLTFLIGW